MRIEKILNNNVIVSHSADGREIVAMGRGIAFRGRVGDEVADDKCEKIYRLSNTEMPEHFKELVAGLSIDILQASSKVIEEAERQINTKFNDSIYVSLTDHIHMAIQRMKENIPIRNMMLLEIQKFYPDEFKAAKWATDFLSAQFKTDFPDDEAGFIAMHFIDAQMEFNQPLANKMLHMIQEIINIVRMFCRVDFDKNSLQYCRFTTHLKYFAKRVFTEEMFADEIDPDMDQMIRRKYPPAYQCMEKVAAFISQKYKYNVVGDEKFYLTVHIAKVIQDSKRI